MCEQNLVWSNFCAAHITKQHGEDPLESSEYLILDIKKELTNNDLKKRKYLQWQFFQRSLTYVVEETCVEEHFEEEMTFWSM